MREKYMRYIVRNIGHTTMIAKAVKECDGILICADQHQADENRKRFNIRTISINALDRMRPMGTLSVFDHHAIDKMNSEYEQRISGLQFLIVRYGLGHSQNCMTVKSPGQGYFCTCDTHQIFKEIKELVELEKNGN